MGSELILDEVYKDLIEFVGKGKLAMKDLGNVIARLACMPHWLLSFES